MARIITNEAEFNNLIAGEKPVLVDFFATWCGPCKMFAPVLDEFAEEHSEIEAIKIDVDQNGEIARRYGIMSIPTVILFKNGVEVKKNVGFLDAESLEEFAEV
jgi:thioredoxin 1